MTPARSRLRAALDREEITTSVAIHDALTARLAERAGHELLFVGGYNVTLSRLGLPDAGYLTMAEMLDTSRAIAGAVEVPAIADFDTGFGNAVTARRAVREAISTTGLAGLSIEDQQDPKRCGHVAGKRVVSIEEAVGKYRAAADVRDDLDPDFVLVGRTDAIGAAGGSVDDAIERGRAYHEAGADVVWVEGFTDRDQVDRVGAELDAPLMYNNLMGQGSVSPLLGREELQAMGYDITHFLASLLPTMVGVYDHLEGLLENDVAHERRYQERIDGHPVGDLHDFAGFDRVYDLEAEYLPAEDRDRYDDSRGHRPDGDP